MHKRLLSIILILVVSISLFAGAVPAQAAEEGITLRIHYHRPDGNYEDWNVWAWDLSGNYNISGISDLDGSVTTTPAYRLDPSDDDMVCTLTVPTGVQYVGYILRRGNWDEKDIYQDQFINLTGILSGTVDFYVESGTPSQNGLYNIPSREEMCSKVITYNGKRQNMMVLGSDVVIGSVVTSAVYEYKLNSHRLVVELSCEPENELNLDTFKIVKKGGGAVNITEIKKVGSTYYLTLDSRLYYGKSYTLTYDNLTYDIVIDEEYASIIIDAHYDYNSGAPYIALEYSLEPDYSDMDASSFHIYDGNNKSIPIQRMEVVSGTCCLFLEEALTEGMAYWIYTSPRVYILCDHLSHNTNGYCVLCDTSVGHSFDSSNTCSCGATVTPEPAPDKSDEPIETIDPDESVDPVVPDESDESIDPVVPDESVDPIDPDESIDPIDPATPVTPVEPSITPDENNATGDNDSSNMSDTLQPSEGSADPTAPSQESAQASNDADNTEEPETADSRASSNSIPLIVIILLAMGCAAVVALAIILPNRKKS